MRSCIKNLRDCSLHSNVFSMYPKFQAFYIHDRFGRKVAIIISSILMVVFALAIPFSPNYVTFVILRFFLGMANFGLVTTSVVLSRYCLIPQKKKKSTNS